MQRLYIIHIGVYNILYVTNRRLYIPIYHDFIKSMTYARRHSCQPVFGGLSAVDLPPPPQPRPKFLIENYRNNIRPLLLYKRERVFRVRLHSFWFKTTRPTRHSRDRVSYCLRGAVCPAISSRVNINNNNNIITRGGEKCPGNRKSVSSQSSRHRGHRTDRPPFVRYI